MDLEKDYKELMAYFGDQDIILERPIKFRKTPHSKDVIINVIEIGKSIGDYGEAKFTVLQVLRKMKADNKTCGVLYSDDNIKDEHGCLKPHAHNDHHVFRAEDGRLIAWEDDYGCICGCWDDYEKDPNVCRLQWEVKTITE